MRFIIVLAVLAFSAWTGAGTAYAQELDSLRRNALAAKLEEYFAVLDHESPASKMQECDFLVESCTDSLVRQFVALSAYEHFLESPLMGDEAVAIHVFDKWFHSGLVRMRCSDDFLHAGIYAEFNRSSLIGMTAPALSMASLDGNIVDLFGGSDCKGSVRVLYFYDTECSKCRLETLLLRNLFSSGDFPVEIYAVYAGNNEERWREYAAKEFAAVSGNIKVVHLWDPELASDFQRKYGVIVTPRLFLVSRDWTIAGRGLNVAALGRMLDAMFAEKELDYGSDESVALFDGIFGYSGAGMAGVSAVTGRDVAEVADRIASATLEKCDTAMFRQMQGDLLYYLASKSGEGFKEGTAYLVRKYIKGRSDIWNTSSDSLKIVGFSEILDDLLSMAEPGTRLPDIKVPGTLLSAKGSRCGNYSLRKFRKKGGIIIFHTEGCPYCEAEIEAAFKLAASDRSAGVLLVNVDSIAASDPELSESLFDAFDLSSLPFLVETDKKGAVVRRYFSLSGLVR